MSGGGSLSTWGIRNPVPAMMLFFVLCVAGLWGFHQLPVARFPDIAFPMTTVRRMDLRLKLFMAWCQ